MGRFPSVTSSSPEAHDRYRVAYDRAMRDLPRPDAVLDVRTTYGVVRVYRWDGPDPVARPLVLLPGRASGTPMWADNLPGLRALRTVYALDLLGEPGESVQQRPIVDHEDQARWLDETLAALPTDRVHLLGHSIGGWTAMNLALRRPGRLASVSVLDPVQTFAPLPLATVLRSIPASVSWLPRSWRDGFSSYTAGGAPVREVPVADMIEAGMQTYRLATPRRPRSPSSSWPGCACRCSRCWPGAR